MKCFVIMPISTPADQVGDFNGDYGHFAHVYEHLFVPAVLEAGYDPVPPSASGSDLIHAEIIRNLAAADMVLCDMSTLNANVFYELGIRTALNKPLCLVRDRRTTRIPFDTTVVNAHTYDHGLHPWSLAEEIALLTAHIEASRDRSDGQNSMWRYFGITARAGTLDPSESSTDQRLDLIVSQLAALGQMSRRVDPARPERRTALPAAVDRSLVDGDALSDGHSPPKRTRVSSARPSQTEMESRIKWLLKNDLPEGSQVHRIEVGPRCETVKVTFRPRLKPSRTSKVVDLIKSLTNWPVEIFIVD